MIEGGPQEAQRSVSVRDSTVEQHAGGKGSNAQGGGKLSNPLGIDFRQYPAQGVQFFEK